MKKLTVVGLGYVGLPLALLTSKKGIDVVGVDVDPKKISAINSGKSPIEDASIAFELKRKPFSASTSFASVEDSDIVIIAVPTPVKKELPDLTILKSATRSVAEHLKKGALLVIESTINPGVCDDIIIPLVEEVTGEKDGRGFFIAHCPERISPGDKWHLKDINRVVGSNSKKGLNLAVEFYEMLLDAQIKPMYSIKEAEAVKVVENSFRDINIAFVNELAMSFDRMGIDLENVIDGASTKPFGFMPFRPGPGVGGHCIPVDPYYLIEYAKSFGFDHKFMSLARHINRSMPDFVVELVRKALDKKKIEVTNAKVTLLGLAYKANVDDDRESPSYDIRERLLVEGASVKAFDPFIPGSSDFDSLDSALKGADLVIIGTDHDEFYKITPEILNKYSMPILVDARNMLRDKKTSFKEAGILYHGIGQS